jgi:hypothetical protein
MPVTVSYPGVYIEELPSSTHTITAAPTSVTVFIGYTHPFKTFAFNKAIELFSFSDFEREFGGLFTSGVFDTQLAYAVNQFFLNGGSDAYVVGLAPRYYDASAPPNILTPNQVLNPGQDLSSVDPTQFMNPSTRFGATGQPALVFYSLEPTDRVPMHVTLTPRNSAGTIADVTIAYGPRSEMYRNVNLTSADPAWIAKRINGISSLVLVGPDAANGFPTAFPLSTITQTMDAKIPLALNSTFNPEDFTAAFEADSDLDKVSIFNLLVLPGIADNGILSAGLAFCEQKQAFLIMDPPAQAAADLSSSPLPAIDDGSPSLLDLVPRSINGALYFPYLNSQDPLTGQPRELPPGGFVAGIFAREDTNRGVWKAPAGLETTILNTTGVVDRGRMTDRRQGVLNPKGVNCLRSFPGIGTVVYGARTLATGNTSLQQWWYTPVRRTALFIEQTLLRNLGWAVFEPNDVPLWVALRTTVENFMLGLFRQGAFQGTTPSQAFQVKCDSTTTTQDDIDNGIVNIVVAFAPLKPAEFVVIKIAQLAGQTQT